MRACEYTFISVGPAGTGGLVTLNKTAQAQFPDNTTLPYFRGCIMMTWFLHLDQGLCSCPTDIFILFILVNRIHSIDLIYYKFTRSQGKGCGRNFIPLEKYQYNLLEEESGFFLVNFYVWK